MYLLYLVHCTRKRIQVRRCRHRTRAQYPNPLLVIWLTHYISLISMFDQSNAFIKSNQLTRDFSCRHYFKSPSTVRQASVRVQLMTRVLGTFFYKAHIIGGIGLYRHAYDGENRLANLVWWWLGWNRQSRVTIRNNLTQRY